MPPRTSAKPPPAGYGKNLGTRLAWSEGFATWFGITAQRVLNVAAMKIPNAGDTYYDDTDEGPGKNSHINLQANGPPPFGSFGEDNEMSVARALWHMFVDPDIKMSDLTILAALRKAKADTFSKAVAALLPAGGAASFDDLGSPTAAQVKHSNDFACLLTNQNVSPQITSPPDGSTLADAPKISWKANGGGLSNRLNDFVIEFWSPTWGKRMFTSLPITGDGTKNDVYVWTLSAATWATITTATDENGQLPDTLNVVVRGTATTNAPVTGPYKSCAVTVKVPRITAQPAFHQSNGTPVLASIPAFSDCQSELPINLNQVIWQGTDLLPVTQYSLSLSVASPALGPATVTGGPWTTDATGSFVGTSSDPGTIPVLIGYHAWVLTATPAGGGLPVTTTIQIGWTSCISAPTGQTSFTIGWDGAGLEPGTTVTETYDNEPNGGSTTVAADGTYGTSTYDASCTDGSTDNIVTVSGTMLDGNVTANFPPFACPFGAVAQIRPASSIMTEAAYGPATG